MTRYAVLALLNPVEPRPVMSSGRAPDSERQLHGYEEC